jgi:hypothetical protein
MMNTVKKNDACNVHDTPAIKGVGMCIHMRVLSAVAGGGFSRLDGRIGPAAEQSADQVWQVGLDGIV